VKAAASPAELYHRARRAQWIAKAQLKARAARASLELDVHPTARVHAGAVLSIAHGTHNRMTIGPACRIEEGVVLVLNGGTVELGPRVEIRRNTVLHVDGHLSMAGDNILSWGCTIHCGERVDVDEFAGASEYVTIADSRHFHTDEERFFYHNAATDPVRIGRNVWLAAKATVLPGSDIGDCAVVGCNSVVSGAVTKATLVAGAPARPIRSTLPAPLVRPA